MGRFYFVTFSGRKKVLSVVTEDYYLKIVGKSPPFYRFFEFHLFDLDSTFTDLNNLLPFELPESESRSSVSNFRRVLKLSSCETLHFEAHIKIVAFYQRNALEPMPVWHYLDSDQYKYSALADFFSMLKESALQFMIEECAEENYDSQDDFYAEFYEKSRHLKEITEYMAEADVFNNSSPERLRLAEYFDDKGALILLFSKINHKIVALTSIVTENTRNAGLVAKIYGRLHIHKGVPHSIIDRYFEPMTFKWCIDRNITNIFFTINSGNHSVLDWVSRRVGERRAVVRPNRYNPELGIRFRTGFKPHKSLVFERYCWQYVFYASSDGDWFLERKESPLDTTSLEIFRREFPFATQNWD